jgi:hypothetical protein
MKNKNAAFEMSVGTIVTIVLSVTLLVLGIFFVQQVFSSAKGVADLTDQQMRNEINKLFSSEDKIVIYPSTRYIEIKQESTDGVGIGIKNLYQGVSGDVKFSYIVEPEDFSNCGVSAEVAESWIALGKSATDLPIASGDLASRKVLFNIPVGAPLCTVRYRVKVTADGETYGTPDFFDVNIKAK